MRYGDTGLVGVAHPLFSEWLSNSNDGHLAGQLAGLKIEFFRAVQRIWVWEEGVLSPRRSTAVVALGLVSHWSTEI